MEELRRAAHALALVAMELTDALREMDDAAGAQVEPMDAGRRAVIPEHLVQIAELLDDDDLEHRARELRF